MKALQSYVISGIVTAITALLGSHFTNNTVRGKWYECVKPSITPPRITFPIVWTILYVLLFIAFANALMISDKRLIVLFISSFLLNVAWCYFYFVKKWIGTSLFVILLMVALSLLIVIDAYKRKNQKMVWLVLPYTLWLTFAMMLNALSMLKRTKCSEKNEMKRWNILLITQV
jgi:tryptophan-rich sensory protein